MGNSEKQAIETYWEYLKHIKQKFVYLLTDFYWSKKIEDELKP